MATANINGTEIYYEVEGAGVPCLVVHGGLGFDHQHLKRSLTPLTSHFRMIYYDQRGNGRSGRPSLATITMDQLADDAAALLDELGAGPAIVFAHSYGGFVAQELVLRHPEAVRALVLVDTTAGQLGETESLDDEQGPPLPPEAAALMSTLPATDAEFEALSPKMLPFYLHSTPIEQVLPLMRGTLYSASAMARGFEVLAGWSSIERLPRVAVPTLLLWGRHDLVTSLPQARRIANRIPGCEVVVLDKSGHMPWIEEPGQFFPALEDWLRRNGLI